MAKFAVVCHRDCPAFFGDDEAHGIGQLRKSEGRAVPSASPRNARRVLGQREVNRKTSDAIPLDDYGAVMSGRVRVEEALDQGQAQYPVELDAAFEMAFQRLTSGQNDEGTDPIARELEQASNQNVERTVVGLYVSSAQTPHGQSLEELSQFLLKNDHHDKE